LKRALLHIVFFLYTASVVKPVLPMVVDLLAHTFQELEHTSTVHAHNGEQHVHLEMQQLATPDSEDAPAAKIDVSVTPHFLSQINLHISAVAATRREWGRAGNIIIAFDRSSPDPPPKKL
jgi:hypothetical protein